MRRFIILVALFVIGLSAAPPPANAALPAILPRCDQTKYLLPANCDRTGKVGPKCTEYTPETYNQRFPTEKDKIQNPPKVTVDQACGFNDFVQLFINLANWGLAILAIIATFFFIWGGFGLLTSAGNQEKIKAGKSTLWGATFGIVIVLGSWLVINLVVSTLTGTGSTLFARYSNYARPFYGQKCPNYDVCSANDLHFNEETGKGCRDQGNRTSVSQVQTRLKQLGCYDSSVDGCYGPQTKDAVHSFQNYNFGVSFNFGSVDEKTSTAISDAVAGVNGRVGCVAAPLTAEVSVDSAALTPDVVTVRPEGTVTWKNISGAVQTVIFQDAIQDGQPPPVFALNAGQSKSLTFKNPGTYRYSKGPVTGRVVVTFF
ncbi:MAG: peptidoglycan-binding protein [Candidatus Kerfeldbacteria bacterium]|nr:peptidoglycan-binding protein [Candidatus Kerfeldbacteria bacterium]